MSELLESPHALLKLHVCLGAHSWPGYLSLHYHHPPGHVAEPYPIGRIFFFRPLSFRDLV